jgi:hypothetical protein
MGILRVRKAANWTYDVPNRHRRTSYGVGGRDEAILYRVRH